MLFYHSSSTAYLWKIAYLYGYLSVFPTHKLYLTGVSYKPALPGGLCSELLKVGQLGYQLSVCCKVSA